MTESMISELTDMAVNSGATEVKQINPQHVVIAQWVKNKCLYGCAMYGKRFTCPPYTPGIEEMKAVFQSYSDAVLVQFAGLAGNVPENFKKVTETVYTMEKTAFVNGCERALSFGAGTCMLCSECPAAKLENPGSFSKKACLHGLEARPSMEAVGIDVYSTVRNNGFELETVKEYSDPYVLFGLVLLK